METTKVRNEAILIRTELYEAIALGELQIVQKRIKNANQEVLQEQYKDNVCEMFAALSLLAEAMDSISLIDIDCEDERIVDVIEITQTVYSMLSEIIDDYFSSDEKNYSDIMTAYNDCEKCVENVLDMLSATQTILSELGYDNPFLAKKI